MGMRCGSLLCPRWEACAPVVVAEWLRRWTKNPLGSPRTGSNPADYAAFRGEVAVPFFLVPSIRFPSLSASDKHAAGPFFQLWVSGAS